MTFLYLTVFAIAHVIIVFELFIIQMEITIIKVGYENDKYSVIIMLLCN